MKQVGVTTVEEDEMLCELRDVERFVTLSIPNYHDSVGHLLAFALVSCIACNSSFIFSHALARVKM